MEISRIALEGLERAQEKLERAAVRLARGASGETADRVELTEVAVEMIEAVNSYKANLKMVEAEAELSKRTLNILA